MAADVKSKLLTAEEFMKMDLGEGAFELVRGEVVEVPPGTPEHGKVCGNVGFLLYSFGRQSRFGYALSNDSAVVTKRAPDTVRGADVCFYSHVRWPRGGVGCPLPPVAPDLVVEVVSPGDRSSPILRKVAEYLGAGVALVWVVYPARRSVVLYRPDDQPPITMAEGDTIADLPELPGFRCAVAELFV